jgi:4a-hydroxytetrahydrobiopterin dehydratase
MNEHMADLRCTPCRGGVAPLNVDAARQLLAQIPKWQLSDDATQILREFRFGNFSEALAFVNEVGMIAEAEGHHPDLCLGWGYVSIKLQTHKIRGLHENDFIVAAKIDALASA